MTATTLEKMQAAAVLVIGRTVHRVRFAKTGKFATDGYGGSISPLRVDLNKIEVANLVSSRLANGYHAPAIDIDFPIYAIPSSTTGHYHLYLEKEMPWKDYKKLLSVMHDVGLIEDGFFNAAMRSEQTYLRLPHVKKDPDAPTFE